MPNNVQDARLDYALAVEKLLGDARELQTHRNRLVQILSESKEPPKKEQEAPPCQR
jgi:hypothetical protein